jgi:undecaprenyl-diphosphatase
MDLYLFNLINPVKDFLIFSVKSFDNFIFNWVNQFALKWEWFDVLAIFLAEFLQYFLLFGLILFLVKDFKKYLRMIIEAILSALLARFVIVSFIRWILPRLRPFLINNVNLLFEQSGSAFPSGHAAFFFAVATVVYFYNKKIGALFYLSSVLIVLARVFSGVHWPSDILAGTVVGLLVGYLVYKISKKFLK